MHGPDSAAATWRIKEITVTRLCMMWCKVKQCSAVQCGVVSPDGVGDAWTGQCGCYMAYKRNNSDRIIFDEKLVGGIDLL